MAKTILVLAEHLKGKLTDVTFEMLGKAYEISQQTDSKVIALLYGNEIENLTQQLNPADEVLYFEHELLTEFIPETYANLTIQQINQQNPWLILISASSIGLDVSSIISAKFNMPLISSCKELHLENDKLIITSQLLGGKMLLESELSGGQAIVSVLPGAFRAESAKSNKTIAINKLPFTVAIDSIHTKFERFIEPETGDVDITQVPVLISVGRGIQNQDNISLAQELADVIGGAVSASRPVVDQGWLPATRQVGRSGMTVKPKLYLALGLSGAPEHVEGMKDSELIVAINTDPKAPIFNIAHYGANIDALELLPLLKETIEKGKG